MRSFFYFANRCCRHRYRLSLYNPKNRTKKKGPSRTVTKTERQGEWLITQIIDKNNFELGFVPEGTIITVSDYSPFDNNRTDLMYNGSIYLNAWASDDDFDVSPRYVERFSGIKYGSVFNRFERSEQAYGYQYVNFNISKKDNRTREILLDSTTFGPMCIQEGVPERYMNEDCLYLNIWRPSRWKQTLNITSKCRQKFMGGGRFRKDCKVITTSRTIEADGSIVIKSHTNKTSDVIPLGGLYDKDGSLFNQDTDILDNNDLNDFIKKPGMGKVRGLQSVSSTLDNALDNLDEALNDLNGIIDGSEDDENNPNNDDGEEPSTLGTYNIDGSGLLPVMVYIHGGGFMEGSGNDPLFDGSKAAGRGQVIIITLNYRLGIFGFLPSFGWDQWKVNGGMNGFADIIEALTWINRNIMQWGGNPDKITIFGPSSTPAVCLLTLCPAAVGKFQRAILQTSTRETEVRDGRLVTENGVNGASCLLSSQEPYQPLEGRIEIADKFLDYINETYYNFPENPDPTREDLINWLRAYGLNSTALLQTAKDEGTVFQSNRPGSTFDYNRDGNITDSPQRRTFMTWDNDIFPSLPVDLEVVHPVDILVGVRGRSIDDRNPPEKRQKNSDDSEKPSSNDELNGDNIFLRSIDDSNRFLEEAELSSNGNSSDKTKVDGNNDDYFDFYAIYQEDDDLWLEDDDGNQTICSNSSDFEFDQNNETDSNETECKEYKFDFSGTTSDQELCVNKQFAEIMARNVEGKVYAYVIDDGTDFHGYHRRKLEEARDRLDQEHWDQPERRRNLQVRPTGYEYDIETLYFFDNNYLGTLYGQRKEEAKIRKELFNRWINFAKTGVPDVTTRSAAKSRKYVKWDPFPTNSKIGFDTNQVIESDSWYSPSYLYMSADREGQMGKRKSRMVALDELVSHRTLQKYPFNNNKNDICSWVLDDENDHDDDFVEVLLDFNANTAFEYYVTILATLNPTINYVPDREYIAKLPPTLSPTTILHFIDQSKKLEISSSPPSRTGIATTTIWITVLLGATIVLLVVEFATFG